MTDSFRHTNEHRMLLTFATLKMVNRYGDGNDLDGDYVDVEFSSCRGLATAQDTPIEWAMYTICRDY